MGSKKTPAERGEGAGEARLQTAFSTGCRCLPLGPLPCGHQWRGRFVKETPKKTERTRCFRAKKSHHMDDGDVCVSRRVRACQ
jgi:hypothetical protein